MSSSSSSNSTLTPVQRLVEETIAANDVVIFSKSYCPHCKRVKALFSENFKDVTPVIIELDLRQDGPNIQKYLLEKTDQHTVPSVFVKSQHIGGNDDTQAYYKSGGLAVLLEATTDDLTTPDDSDFGSSVPTL